MQVASSAAPTGEVTQLLRAARDGDASAIDRIVPLVYEDLRRLARRQLGRGFGPQSVRPTELVHEAYVKLSIGGAEAAVDRAHFLAIAARAMRQVLVDEARHHQAAKRGGGWKRATLSGSHWVADFDLDELLTLNDALQELDPRQRQVVECRFFGGMEDSEIAEALGITDRTVRRDWVKARAWLYRALARARLPKRARRTVSAMPLSPSRRAEIEEVFERALDLDPARRGAWLSDRCAHDAELRTEVEALIAAHESPVGILERRLTPATTALAVEPLRDRRIGPYRVVRELGRGGMGVVYLAERDDGEFRREVAIKLLRNSPDAEELHRRFIAERQILASLSHPHIAQLLDGGTTEGELPYLVMEYVDGLPITTYCDRHGLDIAARLRLFVDVCRAVNSAHQNLVIHRDIKPGNILVTAAGQVKLLDFGIAKLLNPGMSGMSVPHTRTAFRVMTPEYASPEQVRGEPLTTGSDVYALGVVLYELLAGRRPYQIRTGAERELHELVCEREPERPSTWAKRPQSPDDREAPTPAAIASARGASPDRLQRMLAGDLDAIVMMALRKEPRRRYGSAELVAEDIERYLGGLPVHARHPSRAYYLGKFLRRHRTAASLGAIAVLSLVASTAVAVNQSAMARRERDRATVALTQARQALSESDETTSFLAGLFDANVRAPGNTTPGTTEELIARGMGQIEQLGNRPVVQARMLEGMGRIYQNSGRLSDAKTRVRALARAAPRQRRWRECGGGHDVAPHGQHVAGARQLCGRRLGGLAGAPNFRKGERRGGSLGGRRVADAQHARGVPQRPPRLGGLCPTLGGNSRRCVWG